ncbi:hypothetical protein WJX72_004834 [[Myrmecia] bisecta]|uniref:F-box domain-containing protein n=1 Tax=[Myrmecia] bisecta TaxID=41462 RepID=A0AAW1QRL5_9CHLO
MMRFHEDTAVPAVREWCSLALVSKRWLSVMRGVPVAFKHYMQALSAPTKSWLQRETEVGLNLVWDTPEQLAQALPASRLESMEVVMGVRFYIKRSGQPRTMGNSAQLCKAIRQHAGQHFEVRDDGFILSIKRCPPASQGAAAKRGQKSNKKGMKK